MKLKDFSLILIFCCSFLSMIGQSSLSGKIIDRSSQNPVAHAQVFIIEASISTFSDSVGNVSISGLSDGTYQLAIVADGYGLRRDTLKISGGRTERTFLLDIQNYELSEVIIAQKREELFAMKRLQPVEGTAIYAGKKNEVVLLDQLTANIAANNPRQIYSQVAGLNIFEGNDAGLQLNIGGRGLDPNRSANFNLRQNGYDISADVLGYPESYYTPPAEALSEIQIIRGAASLQYGTQFGGLINFRFRQPLEGKKLEWTSRQAIGSNKLFTSFNSFTGTVGKLSYLAYFNYKKGEGFRPNSGFEAKNLYADLHYHLTPNTMLDVEFTYLNYLAQQAGGLTDAQFLRDPNFSNRSRNWFEIDWRLLSVRLEHKFSYQSELSFNVFGLDASRNAIGFRTNRVSQSDDLSAPRDLILGDFNNWGVETRWLTRYKIGNKKNILLIGNKYYQSMNTAVQGPGSAGSDPDFTLMSGQYPFYPNQSDFIFPNKNLAFFSENVLNINDKLSITPGIRFEYILTQSEGTYKKIDFDLAGNPIRNSTFEDARTFDRKFVLLGLGLSYKPGKHLEAYGNFSQNYRSVTFSDIRVVNPSFQIDPNITDENGFTTDFGLRGRYRGILSYDISAFGLLYNDRLGEVLKEETRETSDGAIIKTGKVVRFRGNIGSAFLFGLESLIDWNIRKTLWPSLLNYKLNAFVNTSLTHSQYIASEIPGVVGNRVEFIPLVNLKTGINAGINNFLASLQYTFLSEQYTDASNAEQNINDNQSGIIGSIPAYQIMDFSCSYTIKFFRLEGGVNNLLNQHYFTRRATGYPGPGIIPSAPRTWYLALQVKL